MPKRHGEQRHYKVEGANCALQELPVPPSGNIGTLLKPISISRA
jgi:hypothetical protein